MTHDSTYKKTMKFVRCASIFLTDLNYTHREVKLFENKIIERLFRTKRNEDGEGGS